MIVIKSIKGIGIKINLITSNYQTYHDNKENMKLTGIKQQIVLFFILNLFLGFWGLGLKEQNPEELFLSDKAILSLKNYEKFFGKDQLSFVSGLNDLTSFQLSSSLRKMGGEFASLSAFLPGHAVFKLPELDDQKRFDLYSQYEILDPDIRFLGMSYTNAQLAGMSLKMQKIHFPLIFLVIFIGLVFLFRRMELALYLFLTSFLGVTVALAFIKIVFSYSTILTSLAPIVAFILTMANQLHVIFGLYTYKNKKEFFKKKLAPILIMMGTTLIGFAGLIFSDLLSIRQFAIATTFSLFITWGINLLVLNYFNISFDFVLTDKGFLFQKKIKRPSYRPALGLLILCSLLLAGIFSVKKMPLLVEAMLFFPEGHPIRIAQSSLQKSLGGLPQVDIIITRKDKNDLEFKDFKNLSPFELNLVNANLKIFSPNEMVSKANYLYSGERALPLNNNAYFLLRSQIPELLKNSLVSDKAYRISILSAPQKEQERELMLNRLNQVLLSLPHEFQYQLSGLNYLLLQSQGHLVKTLLTSLLGSFLLIAFIFAFFSRNLGEILTFSLISLSAIFGGLFIMHLCGFGLNVASVMTLSISIGLVDDSTIHLLYAQRHQENNEAITKSCLHPMILSQIVLFLSFILLGFESFIPIREFSWGLVIMLTMGFLIDLYILPMLNPLKKTN